MNHNLFDRLRPGTADCPSEMALDKRSCEALSPAEQRLIAQHIESCEICVERLELRRLGLEAFPLLDEAQQIAEVERRLNDASGPIRTDTPRPFLVCTEISQRNPVD
jgi:hypothetical protein